MTPGPRRGPTGKCSLEIDTCHPAPDWARPAARGGHWLPHFCCRERALDPLLAAGIDGIDGIDVHLAQRATQHLHASASGTTRCQRQCQYPLGFVVACWWPRWLSARQSSQSSQSSQARQTGQSISRLPIPLRATSKRQAGRCCAAAAAVVHSASYITIKRLACITHCPKQQFPTFNLYYGHDALPISHLSRFHLMSCMGVSQFVPIYYTIFLAPGAFEKG